MREWSIAVIKKLLLLDLPDLAVLVQFQLCRVLRHLMLQEISRKAYVGLLVKGELFLV